METLADRITREGPLTELDAVGWAIRLAKRIESMHALGVTHGSVSPQCVLVEGKDRTARASLVDVRRTPSSAAYHSPERASGGGLSQADDTWALACTLYAALTGSTPFSGANDAEIKQKILSSTPAPLAVFDVGDDDLQRVLDDALTRELAHRTSTVGALRRALEEWHPDPNVSGLPGLEDEDTEGGSAGDEEEEDERTIMRLAPMMIGKPAAPSSPEPRASSPGGFPAPRASSPGGFPAPRASSPGGSPGVSPLASSRSGPAARAVPLPRASAPGAGPAPFAAAPSRDVRPPAARASSPQAFAPPDLRAPSSPDRPRHDDEEEEEDEKTMMRSVPENLAAAMQARMPDASRSGAFAAAAPSKSGAFPALAAPPVAHDDEEPEDEEEATRMISSAALLAHGAAAHAAGRADVDDDEDDEQKTIMRTSLTPEEVARLEGAAPPPRSASRDLDGEPTAPAVEPPKHDDPDAPLGGTMTLDALHLAHAEAGGDLPLAAPDARTAADAGAQQSATETRSAEAPGAFPMDAAPVSLSHLGPPGAAPLSATGVGAGTGAALAPAPSRSRAGLWIAIVLLLLIAAATFAFLRYR